MKNLENYKILNKKVLFRADLNVPVVNGHITDISRIEAVKPSIQKLILRKNKIFIISHFGRPKGGINKKFSLEFIIPYLKKVLEIDKIHFLKNLNEKEIDIKNRNMKDGEVCLIENIRFQKEEENIDLEFTKRISVLFNVFVNDAFSSSHRNHMSIVGFPNFLPAVAGDHLLKEIHNINFFLKNTKKPNMAILGGSKISTKIQLLKNLIEQFSLIAVGGAMANTFLLAKKINIGKSLVEKNLIDEALIIKEKAKKFNCKLILPTDVVCGKNIQDRNPKNCNIEEIEPNEMILDIGKNTTKAINEAILKSKMVLWNGPLGAFEYKPYDISTNEIAKNIKLNAKKNNISMLAGGGDTISAIKNTNSEDAFNYISNAGGAFLEWLEGNESPGVISLKKNKFI